MKKIAIFMISGVCPLTMMGQSALDAYQLSQNDLKGTARFVSMGGAFGALGGDLSTLSQNPGGIGVYRSNEIGFTLGLDCYNAGSDYYGSKMSENFTKFNLNNIGAVGTLRLNKGMRNLNIGFSYNRAASFNRRYRGDILGLKTSLSNYIAGIANNYSLTEADVQSTNSYDPYNPGAGDRFVPWSPIIGYDSYLIDPEGNPDSPLWQGQFGQGTTGNGYFDVQETGHLDEYNIVIGGNIADKVYWGMNFGIVDVDYTISSVWQEDLKNAYVYNPNFNRVGVQDANWYMDNLYNINGSGFNYQLGVIYKPIQELRLGFAFHTPTFFNLTENYYADQIDYRYNFEHNPNRDNNINGNDYAMTNDGNPTYDKVRLQTPWKIIASVAGVIGNKCIISFDYEWNGFKNMKFKEPNNYYYGYYDDWYYDDFMPYSYYTPTPIEQANETIRTIFCNASTIRVGAEYRVTNGFSVRAGFNYNWSPVTSEAKDNLDNIPSAGTLSNYRLDNNTMYVTAGLGYRYKGFYIDGAYVYKHQTSSYQPFAADPNDISGTAMTSKLNFNNSQVVLSAGYKF